MTFRSLLELEGMMLLFIAAGIMLRRSNLITEQGKQAIVDLCIWFIIPCNIIQAFCMELQEGMLEEFGKIFLVSVIAHAVCILLGHLLFSRYPAAQRSVLQYATVCSNGGFMGNAVAEGLFGSIGLVYTSIFLIPMRIVMWGFGPSYFTGTRDWKSISKKVATHPCMIGIYIGLVLMLTQFQLPAFLDGTIRRAGSCTVPLTMLVVGMILSQEKLSTLFSKTTLYFSAVRLGILPLFTLILCRAFSLETVSSGVCVVLMGLPAATMTPIMADRYGGDAGLASRCLVLTTGLSLLTLTVWGLLL